jgi:hypothetical protein
VPYNGVQERQKGCFAGAIARSLDWLNRQYNMGVDKSVDDFYADLEEAEVTATIAGKGFGDEPNPEGRIRGYRLAQKVNYVNGVFGPERIRTQVWDAGSSAPNAGAVITPLPKSSPRGPNPVDLDAWLRREWQAGEDIEVGWVTKGGGHAVTLTEVAVDADGNFKIKYREDRAQTSPRGDAGPTDGTIFRGQIGDQRVPGWRFSDAKGGDHSISFAVSESPNPANPPR